MTEYRVRSKMITTQSPVHKLEVDILVDFAVDEWQPEEEKDIMDRLASEIMKSVAECKYISVPLCKVKVNKGY